MEIVPQLALFLENRPGTLAAVCDALSAAKINIFALTISDTVDHAVVRMVVSDTRRALSIFEEHGTLVVENEVLMIEYAYLSGSPRAKRGLLILRPNNVKKAFEVLSK